MNMKEQINRPFDWDVEIYLLRRVSPLRWKPLKVASYAMFNTSAVEMQRIANASIEPFQTAWFSGYIF